MHMLFWRDANPVLVKNQGCFVYVLVENQGIFYYFLVEIQGCFEFVDWGVIALLWKASFR